LTAAYWGLAYLIDYFIAVKLMGDLQRVSGSVWTSVGTIKWTFSSVLGPAFAISKYVALAVAIVSGLLMSLLVRNIIFRVAPLLGSHYWLAIAILLTWILRFPVPLRYSLYYFACVRY